MNDSVICVGKIYLVQLKVDDEWDGKDLLWAICHTGKDNVNFYFLSVQLGGLLACCYLSLLPPPLLPPLLLLLSLLLLPLMLLSLL